jgi:hypothetical protein
VHDTAQLVHSHTESDVETLQTDPDSSLDRDGHTHAPLPPATPSSIEQDPGQARNVHRECCHRAGAPRDTAELGHRVRSEREREQSEQTEPAAMPMFVFT